MRQGEEISGQRRAGDKRGSGVLDAVRENREALEELADSDLRSAKYAKELLDVLDETDERRG